MAPINRNNAYRTVCLITTKRNDGSFDIATGSFILDKSGNPYMVTALHAAKGFNAGTCIELANDRGIKPSVFNLMDISLSSHRYSSIADLAVFPLKNISPPSKKIFTNRFLAPSAIKGDISKPVNREIQLTVVGFPNGLGHDNKGNLVPLTYRTYASSDYMELKDPDFSSPLTVFALEDSSLGGYSGAPVYDLDSKDNGIYGFIKGNLKVGDGSISIVTPAEFARYLM